MTNAMRQIRQAETLQLLRVGKGLKDAARTTAFFTVMTAQGLQVIPIRGPAEIPAVIPKCQNLEI